MIISEFENELTFANYIDSLGGNLYIVGGYVRDKFLNRNSKDKDYVITGVSIDDIPFNKIVGAKFPVFLINVNGEQCEIALARTEYKNGTGHNGFNFYTSSDVTIEEDLCRRDLTINAIAINVLSGKIIDPFNGIDDIKCKVLKHVSDSFKDDYLRIFRVARFTAQLNFSVTPELFQLLYEMGSGTELSEISYERIWKETEYSLLADYPTRYFLLLKELNILENVMPELAALDVLDMHDGTSLIHTLNLLEHGNPCIEDKLSLLCHDFGKGVTDKDMHPKHYGHEKLGIKEVEIFCDRFKIPTNLKKLVIKSSAYHMTIKSILDMRVGKCFKYLSILNTDFIHVSRISFIDSAFREGGDIESSMKDHKDRCVYFSYYLKTIKMVTGKSLIEGGYKGEGKKFGEVLFNRRVNYFRDLIKENQ